MDYKINHRNDTYLISTAISADQTAAARQILVGRLDEIGEADFYYFGDNIDDAVNCVEEDVGHLHGLRRHIAENWGQAGLVNWSEETLLLDATHVYVVEYRPVVEAECDMREQLNDDIESAFEEASKTSFACGGEVSLSTLSGVKLYSKQIGHETVEFFHPDFDHLRHLEADRRSYQISDNDGFAPAPDAPHL